ncbi:MAG: ISKra4 family transposase [Chloroflexi bacterium]|nr:ISKra4 family transposase [Chloroflexota bacterium]
MQEALARLGTRLPFAQAAAEFTAFTQVPVSDSTTRRHTEAAGAAYVAVQTADVDRIEQEARAPRHRRAQPSSAPPVPAVLLQGSVDGAFVPLVGGEWAEVKTRAVGEVVLAPDPADPDGPQPHATALSYFSRLATAETFTRLATGELERRGVDRAGVVVAPLDGAEWQQGFLDVQCPQAVRILDFPHAVEYLTKAVQAVWGHDSAQSRTWLEHQRHELQHGNPSTVRKALARLPVQQAPDPSAAATEARAISLQYLTKRLDQIQYATFRQQGYPIGSGCVESANTLVVEARVKGSGMHGEREHVDPVLALRNALCRGRWSEAWQPISQYRRLTVRQQRAQRQQAHHAARPCRRAPLLPPVALVLTPPTRPARPPRIVNGRPTADHPWRRPFLSGSRRFASSH